MSLLEDIKSGKYNLIIIIIIFVFIFHIYHKQSYTEKMTDTSEDTKNMIKEAVKNIYNADVESIRNLAEVATKLQKEGLTIPGNLTVTGSFNYLPKGSIIAYNQSNSAPPGWTLCDGSNGSPDLRGRFVLGNGGTRDINTIGGEENVTLGVHQIPKHNHEASGTTDSKGSKNFGIAKAHGDTGNWHLIGVGGEPLGERQTADDHIHNLNINVGYTGSGEAHNNMPPFYVLTYIMKL